MNDTEKIQSTLARILSDWGMLIVEPLPSSLQGVFAHDGPLYRATLNFKGPKSGRYEVICQEPFARTLAANVLGTDASDVSSDDVVEVLMELINISSGNLVTAMYGEEQVYTLSPPQVAVTRKSDDVSDFESHLTAVFSGDFEPVGFLFFSE